MAQSHLFILAGFDTTSSTLAFCVHSIAANPRVQARLLAEVDAFGRGRAITTADLDAAFPYTDAIIKEALRLYPPATLTNREVRREEGTAGGGYEITPGIVAPPGKPVFTALYVYQRSAKHWPAPLEFRPERFLPVRWLVCFVLFCLSMLLCRCLDCFRAH